MKHLLLSLLLACSLAATAQIDMGIPAATGKGGAATAMLGNYDAIGINPANLGWHDNYKFSFTVVNVGMSAQSRAIDFPMLRKAFLNPQDTFTQAQKHDLATRFATPDGFNFSANVNWFAASVHFKKFGGLAVNIRDRAFSHVTLSPTAADILFNGVNAEKYQDSSYSGQAMSKVLDGTRLTMLHYRELNIAYGRKLFGLGVKSANDEQPVEFFGGIGFKKLWGLGNIDIRIDDGILTGHSSMTTKYEVRYGNIQNFTPQNSGRLFNAVGTGTAFDFGFSAIINAKHCAAVSFIDLGKIKWTDNVLQASDTLMPDLDSSNTGFNSWDLNSQASLFMADLINYKPGESYVMQLPSRMRLGYALKVNEHIHLGADLVVPLNKTLYNIQSPYIAVGGEAKFGVLRVHAGFAGNKQIGWNVPCGVTIGPLGFLELGLATGDVLTYFAKTNNPNMSFALGLIRFNFGKHEDEK